MAKGYFIVAVIMAAFAVLVGGSMSGEQAAPLETSERRAVIEAPSDEGSSEASTVAEDGAVELERSADGHFYANVLINGTRVRALVDTGATGIALSREDARNAGIATSIGMPEVVGRGADGDVFGEQVTLERVVLGHRSAEGMDAIVLNSGQQTLLGQSFLSQFDAVEIRGETMVLR